MKQLGGNRWRRVTCSLSRSCSCGRCLPYAVWREEVTGRGMAKNKTPPAPSATAEQQTPRVEEDDLPEVVSFGLAQHKKGWVVVRITSQGYKILDTEAVCEVLPRGAANDELRKAVAKEFLMPKAGVLA